MNPPDFIPFGGSEVQCSGIDAARIVVLPLCYEKNVSYGAGSGSGPYHILAASEQIELLDEETLIDWGALQIHTRPPLIPPGTPREASGQMQAEARKVLAAGKFLLALGGDHAVSIATIAAAAALYPDLGVLQIDAHLDLRDRWNGSRFNHACVMRRVCETLRHPPVQVGIRSFSREEADFVRQMNLAPFYAQDIVPWDEGWIDKVLAALPDRVYLTLDLDGLDPSVVPGTGTPEPGGLSYRQVLALIRRLGAAKRLVAADINELAKIEGTQVSEFTAARLACKIMVHCWTDAPQRLKHSRKTV